MTDPTVEKFVICSLNLNLWLKSQQHEQGRFSESTVPWPIRDVNFEQF